MNTLPVKNWNSSIPSSKKYLSRLFTYRLSQKLNSKEFDVLFESPLSKDDHNEPDVVVFDKKGERFSIMAIEICLPGEINDVMIIARELMEKYSLLDFFLFDLESEKWYNVRKANNGYSITSDSSFMGVDLESLNICYS